MKKIETYKQLQEERKLTKQKIALLGSQIEEDIEDIKNSLNPIQALGHTVKKMVTSENDGVLANSIALTVDTLIKKLLFRKSGWITKSLVSYILKNVAKNVVSKNSGNILNWMIQKIRGEDSPSSNGHYHKVATDEDWGAY